jgi:hypothetical protein
MADIGMAAFSVFFMQCPSFLAHQRALLDGQGRSNSQTLFKMTEIPSDNHIRDMLDPVDPSLFHPLFDKAVAMLEESGGLDAMRCLGGPGLDVRARRRPPCGAWGDALFYGAFAAGRVAAQFHGRSSWMRLAG